MSKKESAKKVGKTIGKETFNILASKTPILSEIKGYIDSELTSKVTENISNKTKDNCKHIQMIVEYLQTQNPELLKILGKKYSGFGIKDGEKIVPACNIEDVNYKTVAKETREKISQMKPSKLSKISEDDNDVIEFVNPLGLKRKRRKKSKRNTKRKSRRNKTKKKTRRNKTKRQR